jgi:hypothetical protein
MLFGYELALGGWRLIAILAAATALLVWLHRSRQRRRRVLVSFEPLWAHLPGGTGQGGLPGKLRRYSPLLLQLAVICALLAAAADPRRQPRLRWPLTRVPTLAWVWPGGGRGTCWRGWGTRIGH